MKIRHSVAVLFLLSTVGVPFVDADEGAVRKTLTEYVDVFNQKTAEKIAGFWTENGTHTDRQTGQRTAGREAIQADVMKLMKEGSDFKLSATITGIRLITADVASVEGETTVVISDADPLVSKTKSRSSLVPKRAVVPKLLPPCKNAPLTKLAVNACEAL